MVEKFMSDTRVPQKLKEIAILVIARAYRAQYAWAVHGRRARRFGLEQSVIDAIAAGRNPSFADAREAAVHDTARELTVERTLSEATYTRLVQSIGEEATVELVSLIGFYIAVAVLCVAFSVDPPEDAGPTLPEAR
jgi:4-carboxymuconolactone decarboxylase